MPFFICLRKTCVAQTVCELDVPLRFLCAVLFVKFTLAPNSWNKTYHHFIIIMINMVIDLTVIIVFTLTSLNTGLQIVLSIFLNLKLLISACFTLFITSSIYFNLDLLLHLLKTDLLSKTIFAVLSSFY